jgi:hypothetical protein
MLFLPGNESLRQRVNLRLFREGRAGNRYDKRN